MGLVRDYLEWHTAYDDPDSGLSWRLRTVQGYIRTALDEHDGPLQVLSLCAGDGRDMLSVLAGREDAARIRTTLVELHPQLADRARSTARSAGLVQVDVRVTDAGNTDCCLGAVPADLLLLVGIFGNISDADIERTIATAAELCRAGATVLWSRAREPDDINDRIRSWFAAAGFTELDYATREDDGRPGVGAFRFDGEARVLRPGRRLFTFQR